MLWSSLFAVREYLRTSLWPVPVAGIVIGFALKLFADYLEQNITLDDGAYFDASTTTAIFGAILTATISFVGFVLTMLVLVVQFAGSLLSVRVLHYWFRELFLKVSLAFFLATVSYSFWMLTEVHEGSSLGPSVYFGFGMVLFSLVLFMALLSHLLANLRPATLAYRMGKTGAEVIRSIYPDTFSGTDPGYRYALPVGEPLQVIHHDSLGGAVQAYDRQALLDLARQVDGQLLMGVGVGEYMQLSGVLAERYGGMSDVDESAVREHVAIAAERTFEQDPGFPIRTLVDVAAKALSPAINDPTTAIQCIDRLEDLLVLLSTRDLDISEVKDDDGITWVIIPVNTWDDYLWLALTEIRQYGSHSIQIARRLRLLLVRLLDHAPEARKPAVQQQLDLLTATAEGAFAGVSDDLVHAARIDLLQEDPGEATG